MHTYIHIHTRAHACTSAYAGMQHGSRLCSQLPRLNVLTVFFPSVFFPIINIRLLVFAFPLVRTCVHAHACDVSSSICACVACVCLCFVFVCVHACVFACVLCACRSQMCQNMTAEAAARSSLSNRCSCKCQETHTQLDVLVRQKQFHTSS